MANASAKKMWVMTSAEALGYSRPVPPGLQPIGYNHAPVIPLLSRARYDVVALLSRTPALRAHACLLDHLCPHSYVTLWKMHSDWFHVSRL